MSEAEEQITPAEVLIVDDDDLVRATLGRILERNGHRCRFASNAGEALHALREGRPDVILSDVMMPGGSGLDLLHDLGTEFPGVPVVMVSGVAQLEVARTALQRGAYGWVTKPFDSSQVLIGIDNALIRARLEEENSAYRDHLKAMVKQRTLELGETVEKLQKSEEGLRRVTEDTIREVVDIARSILSDLDTEKVLDRVLEAARAVSGARYAALGVLDESRTQLARFTTSGIDGETRESIGPPPTGHGVLGELIHNPVPLMLADVGQHPHSYGFPHGHPSMRSFLGVPVYAGGKPFGNLYLTEKRDREQFTDEDQRAVVLLAELAGVAIDHANRYSRSEARRRELERTVDALQATVQIARTLGGHTDIETVLEIIAKRARALVTARAAVVMTRDGDELVVAAIAGELPERLIGHRARYDGSIVDLATRKRKAQRPADRSVRARLKDSGFGALGIEAVASLIVPIMHGPVEGAVTVMDRTEDGPQFTDHDQRLLEAFVDSAATGLAAAHAASTERDAQHETIGQLESELAHLRTLTRDPVNAELARLAEPRAPGAGGGVAAAARGARSDK